MIYFVLPRFILHEKYGWAFLWTALFMFLTASVNMFMVQNLNATILQAILPERFLANTQRPPAVTFAMAILSSLKGGITCTAVAVGIKLVKHWYLKEQRNLILQKENSEAQLQLLTAQVHPHFLFNTLNNIYSQTQTESPKGSQMIMELSDMLRYILAEGGKPMVPLKKELAMIQDYMNLEKIRYGNKLDLHLSLPEVPANLQIAPLILLPFVENCFKHGASKFLSAPWINLKIEIENDTILFMKLMNGKDSGLHDQYPKSGTGLSNVKKRLELLYREKHELQITDEPEVFVVNLRLELLVGRQEPVKTETSQPKLNYA
jgi:LytS/YehU family sensor histidine kinase